MSLPQELVDLVIDDLWNDKVALSNCTLVSREWVYSARRHLFNKVTVHVRDDTLSSLRNGPLSVTQNLRHLTLAFGETHLRDVAIVRDSFPFLQSIRLKKLDIPTVSEDDTAVAPCHVQQLFLDDIALDPLIMRHILLYIRASELRISQSCNLPTSSCYRTVYASSQEEETLPDAVHAFTSSHNMEHIDIGHPDACELVSHAIQRLTLSFTFSSISFRWLRLDGRANTRTLLAHCGPALTSLSLNLSAFYNDDKGEGANVPDFGVRHCPNLARVALGLADPLESWGVLKRVLVQLFAAGERTRCIELQLALPPSALAHVGAFDEVLAPYVPERVGTVRILAKLSAGNAEAGALEAVARPLSGWEQEIVRERLPSVSKGVLCF